MPVYEGSRSWHIDRLFNTGTAGQILTAQLIDHLVGDHIGNGVERTVFEFGTDGTKVLKIEPHPRANVLEFEIWQEVKETDHNIWFAPVISISPCGCFLVMERTTELEIHEYPEKIPSYMADTHSGNWGKIGKDVVCHDYANNLIMQKGFNRRMVKARFR